MYLYIYNRDDRKAFVVGSESILVFWMEQTGWYTCSFVNTIIGSRICSEPRNGFVILDDSTSTKSVQIL